MRILVRVLPRSSRNTLEWESGGLKARLTAPPVEGAANAALVALLADKLTLPRRNIRIVHGANSRQKMVEIIGTTVEEVAKKISTSAV